jgi:hypothetical protein
VNVGDILGSIFGFFGGLAGFFGGLDQLLTWLGSLLGSLVKFLQTLWQFLVKHIIGGILNALRSLSAWLEEKLAPVIDFLKRVRAAMQSYYETYIRPFMVYLQRVRQFLSILALLHIHIAQRLDTFLTNLQSKIIQSFYTVTAAINTLTNILLALQDPEYLIKHPVLLLSIRRQIPALIHALTGRPPGYWFPSPRGSAGGPFAPPSFPFNFADPSQNPPTSSYLSNDGLPADLSGVVNCYEYTADAVDTVAPLDFFNDDLYPDTLCPYEDPAKCLLYSWGVNV